MSVADPLNPERLPTITVIVPVLNEERHIAETLRQLGRQDYPADCFDIVVADGGSTDRTRERIHQVAKTLPVRLQLLDNPRRLSGAARNLGVLHARGDFVLVVDGHVFIPSQRLLSDMAASILTNGASVLGRPQPQTPPDISHFQAMVAAVRASPLAHSTESRVYSKADAWVSPISVGVMYKRALFEEFGLFDENMDAVEDLEFNYRLERAGLKAYLSSKFTVLYYPRGNLRQLFRQMYRYGLGRINFARKHPERLRLEVFAPLIACAAAALAIVASFALPTSRAFLGLAGLVAAAGVTLIAAFYIPDRKFNAIWLAPVCLLTIHVGLAYGVLCALFGRGSGPVQRHTQDLAVTSNE